MAAAEDITLKSTTHEAKALTLEDFKREVLEDYKLAVLSREVS